MVPRSSSVSVTHVPKSGMREREEGEKVGGEGRREEKEGGGREGKGWEREEWERGRGGKEGREEHAGEIELRCSH